MKRIVRAIILILILFGHNFVINEAQSLQNQIQKIHKINVTQFNLLYSIPSAIALVFIIPISLLYQRFSNTILFGAALVLLLGQILVAIFGPQAGQYNFLLMVTGRTFQGTGAEVLYMIQGNLASTWMSKLAGLIFILPQLGQILNAFITPFVSTEWGMSYALWLGVIGCCISFIACWYLYCHLKQQTKVIQKIQVNLQIKNQNQMISYEVGDQHSSNHGTQKQSNDLGLGEVYTYNNGQIIQNSSDKKQQIKERHQPKSLLKAGKIFWLTVSLCAINECLYFPFLDNANELIQIRFKIPYQSTGYYLCLPFVAAIFTTAVMNFVLKKYDRKQLIFYTAILPLIGHGLIYLVPNTQSTQLFTSVITKLCLILGFLTFGTGLGCYYSVSFPSVGLAVPQKIRGGAYGVLCFFQTLAMFVVPIISGQIIQANPKQEIIGYKNSSELFVFLCLLGLIIGFAIKVLGNKQSFHFDDYQDLLEQTQKSDESLKN